MGAALKPLLKRLTVGSPAALPTLDLDFLAQSYKVSDGAGGMNSVAFADLVAFTRSGAAWRYNEFGIYEQVAANQPRFDYDPVTLALRGLLVEEQRTNLLAVASDFTSGYAVSANLTPSVGAAAPISGQSYRRFTKVAPGSSNPVSKTAITLSAGLNTLSVFARLVNVGQATLRFYDSIGDAATAVFDLSTGSVVRTSGSVLAGTRAEKGPNGSWRFSVTANYTSRDTAGGGIYFYVGDVSVQGSAGDAIDLWGGQLEAGVFPTSYIPTTGSQVTRAADVASVNTLSPWFNSVEGTLFCEFVPPAGGSNSITLALVGDSAFHEFYDDVNKRCGIYSVSSSANLVGGLTLGVLRAATAYNLHSIYHSVNGSAAVGRSQDRTYNHTELRLGRNQFSASLNGHIRRIRYWPRRLFDNELQRITA
ncbi:hypothetical protein [Pseudomonas citronellolis]|uniref:phage head spike fiber domain-containing protein n=1 Tax=Pseudomonas citronellolis TaxID=53408 RepID=UPI00248E46F3|nr:hypothetical protein [Pseudomonas citronellolis]